MSTPIAENRLAFYQVADSNAKSYAVQCAVATMAYLDGEEGWYDCWAPSGAAGEHFRWTYIASAATLAPAALPAPTAAVSSQTAGLIGMAPATSSPIRLRVEKDLRLAILYSAAGPVTLYCVKVL